MTAAEVDQLLADPGIIRHRGKIESAVKGAQIWLELEETGPGFAPLIWDYVDGTPLQNHYTSQADVPTQNVLSTRISKDLRARGFTFAGPVIVYAWMEACGLMNNHLAGCFRHAEVMKINRG